MGFKRFLTISIYAFLLTVSPVFAKESNSAAFYTDGCLAFSNGNWESSVSLLKKAVEDPLFDIADVRYMLISAEIYAGDEKSALVECDDFLTTFKDYIYYSRVQYTKGKLLFNLKEYNRAYVILSDFCHNNKEDDFYPTALFYMAECLYADSSFDYAETLYEQIVKDYSDNEKAEPAQFRLESIAQRSREEKLLYLLQQTNDELAAAKADYENQVKLLASDSNAVEAETVEKLLESQRKNKELEEQLKDMENQLQELKVLQSEKNVQFVQSEVESQQKVQASEVEKIIQQKDNQNDVKRLKEKAQVLQLMLNKRMGE